MSLRCCFLRYFCCYCLHSNCYCLGSSCYWAGTGPVVRVPPGYSPHLERAVPESSRPMPGKVVHWAHTDNTILYLHPLPHGQSLLLGSLTRDTRLLATPSFHLKNKIQHQQSCLVTPRYTTKIEVSYYTTRIALLHAPHLIGSALSSKQI